jgi:GT2 family glycosyltransferase
VAEQPTFGVVILTMGQRPVELQRALASLLEQRNVTLDVVVVGNAWVPTGLPDGVHGVHLAENLGAAAGRNAGVPYVTGEYLFFLDDDASLPDPYFLASVADRFAADPRLGVLQPRVMDPEGKAPPRRWVPRLRVGDPSTSSPATALWEGAIAIRRGLFDAVGGWPGEFFIFHEGIDLAWRVWDQGYVPWYAAELVVNHPVLDPARHEVFYRFNARNRVWLARRNLPVVLEPLYVGTWVGMTLLRVHDPDALKAWFAGLREGVAQKPAGRRRMKWSTVWAMTKAGRPPII